MQVTSTNSERHPRAGGDLAKNDHGLLRGPRLRGGPPKRHDGLCSSMYRRLVLSLLLLLPISFAQADTAYVTNEKDDTVSVIDLDTWTVTRTFEVGQRPRGIALSPDNKILYVCTSDDNTIRAFSTETLERLHDLPSGENPETFIVSPDGGRIYTSNESDNIVTVIDTVNRTVLAQIDVGVEPEGIAVSPDGKIAINTSETTNMAHWIETENYQIIENSLVDQRPRVALFDDVC